MFSQDRRSTKITFRRSDQGMDNCETGELGHEEAVRVEVQGGLSAGKLCTSHGFARHHEVPFGVA